MAGLLVLEPARVGGYSNGLYTTTKHALIGYCEMLRMELRGERFRKTEIVRRLESMIPARNSRAIEAKFQNISAIRDEAGLLWIDGYKPLPHY